MQRILLLNASPRRDGTCAEAVYTVKTMLEKARVLEYSLYDLNPAACIDCGYCKTNDGCSIKDLDLFFLDFEQADAVLIFSPVYNNFFPGPLKNLLDRFQRYYAARFFRNQKPPIARPKQVGVFLCSGSDCPQVADYMFETLRQSFTVLNGRIVSKLYVPSTDTKVQELGAGALSRFTAPFTETP
ncbi:MAG TPA: flavodoxin family protein [Candidatus Scubalenecus merdavium]|uniref:Flavodoxin family protein n=1 Tax=Candidatus Scybalenecus merdavium TaxID=2840939 RepID=A0A9D1MU78_9FIRM|nr:flavodoxin family protein [Candidatus Scubalenecus merdavium]